MVTLWQSNVTGWEIPELSSWADHPTRWVLLKYAMFLTTRGLLWEMVIFNIPEMVNQHSYISYMEFMNHLLIDLQKNGDFSIATWLS